MSFLMLDGRDAVLLVVGHLDARRRLVSSIARRIESVTLVGIHDDRAFDVPRRAPDGLDQRAFRAQEALLVGVENRDQRDLRQIEPLAQQVDADHHVVDAQPQVAQDLDALDSVSISECR